MIDLTNFSIGRPLTGRCEPQSSVLHIRNLNVPTAHQIRVHLQYLGHPVANDQVYSEERIWVRSGSRPLRVAKVSLVQSGQGKNLGKGGVDLTPSNERSAPLPPSELPESSDKLTRSRATSQVNGGKLLPRETGHDIGMGSPVPLSKEAVGVITRLRNLKVWDIYPLRFLAWVY